MTISVLPLSCGDLFPALLDGGAKFHQLFCLSFCIRHIWDISIGWNGPDGSLYPRVGTLFSEKQRDTGRGMNVVVVGKLG